MGDERSEGPEALASLWAGEFGDAYVERNIDAGKGRGDFWTSVVREYDVRNVLEVGCNVGGNLGWLVELLGPDAVAGVDVNERALGVARRRLPGVDVRRATATALPFDDGAFDLTFTTGVLIHLTDHSLADAMREIVRCSRRLVLCGEYFATEETEVRYRGRSGALFKRDYGRLYAELFPTLRLGASGFLSGDTTDWDDVTYWIFEKT